MAEPRWKEQRPDSASNAQILNSQSQTCFAPKLHLRGQKLNIKDRRNYGQRKVISEADWQLAKQNYEIAKNDVASAEQSVEASRYVIQKY